ncbi:unnamed protein product, partial [Rotaria sp. Silwood2]
MSYLVDESDSILSELCLLAQLENYGCG